MAKRNARDLISDQIIANVLCLNCAKTGKDNLDKDSVSAATDGIMRNLRICTDNRMKWPEQVPVMSKRGQERLKRLVRRADYLEKRISETPPTREVGYDSGELSALRWAVDIIRSVGVIEEESATTFPIPGEVPDPG